MVNAGRFPGSECQCVTAPTSESLAYALDDIYTPLLVDRRTTIENSFFPSILFEMFMWGNIITRLFWTLG